MHIARKFERLLEIYPHPDGRRWSGQEIDEATGGVVTRSYVTNLRKGRIENPGFEKLRAIAKVMSFPPSSGSSRHPSLLRGYLLNPYPQTAVSLRRPIACSRSSGVKNRGRRIPTPK